MGQKVLVEPKSADTAETTDWIQKTCSVHADRHNTTFAGTLVSGFWYRPEDNFCFWYATINLKDIESVSVKSVQTSRNVPLSARAREEAQRGPQGARSRNDRAEEARWPLRCAAVCSTC